MGIAVQKVKLDLNRQPAVPQVVHLGQGDKKATTLQASIYSDGEPFSLSNYTVRFSMMLPDGLHYYSASGTKSGNVATFQIDEAYAASVEGETDVAYVEIISGSTVVASTSRMSVHILKCASEGMEPPESWSSAIEEAEAAAQAIVDMTEATQSQKGLMSPQDKTTIDNLASTYAAIGHTHSNATASAAGFMSAADKQAVDGLSTNYAAKTHTHATGDVTSGTLGVARGGTGKSTHTSNSVLLGNTTSAVKNKATANGAFYATAANGEPSFGTLPIAQGGTGSTSASAARTALGAASQSDMTTVQDSISSMQQMGALNLDNLKTTGIHYAYNGSTGKPSDYGGMCIVCAASESNLVQMFVQNSANAPLYTRRYNSSAWTEWRLIG